MSPFLDTRVSMGSGEQLRVVVMGDILALPDLLWCKGGFGRTISVHWLVAEAGLPGSAQRRRKLAEILVNALQQAQQVSQ